MTDLVERLRKAALIQWQNSPSTDDVSKFMESEAADEIERLGKIAQDKEILRAFFEAVCDDNWGVANGIRAALTPSADPVDRGQAQ